MSSTDLQETAAETEAPDHDLMLTWVSACTLGLIGLWVVSAPAYTFYARPLSSALWTLGAKVGSHKCGVFYIISSAYFNCNNKL